MHCGKTSACGRRPIVSLVASTVEFELRRTAIAFRSLPPWCRSVLERPGHERAADLRQVPRECRRSQEALIPIERATGPVLSSPVGTIACGLRSGCARWSSNRPSEVDAWVWSGTSIFPDAGHVLFPYESPASSGPMPPMRFDLGGSPASARSAHAVAWPEVVQHFRDGNPMRPAPGVE